MFGSPVGLFGPLHCQCWRANTGPALGSPAAPPSICVTSATGVPAIASRAKAVLLSELARKLAAWCGSSPVCDDAAGQGTEVAGGKSACSLV
jgi:hypothetical protein